MPSKRLVFVAAFALPTIGLLIVPFAVMHGVIDKSWMTLANGATGLSGAILVLGAGAGILWKALQVTSSRARALLYRGDFEGALRWAALMGPAGRRFRANIFALAGRLQEAEQIHRGLCVRASGPQRRAGALVALGEVLTFQARYAEAKSLFDEAERLDAGNASTCQELATWYLEQDLEPKAALALIDQGLRGKTGAATAFRIASRAWALARLAREVEARTAIEDALRIAEPRYFSGMALIHLNAGRACAALADHDGARHHFEAAARLDATGLYGTTAMRHLP